jgi:transposase
MYSVHDWAEVHRLHHVEGMSKAAIAARLSMSRNTVARLIASSAPPRYSRQRTGSQVDAFADAVAAMLAEDAAVPATVVTERLRPLGFAGSVTIVKDHLRQARPAFAAARAYQRTSYLPGELAQTDWWHTGLAVPVGKDQTREAFGLVTGLPFSAAFRVVFTLTRTTAGYLPALLGGLWRLGGLPKGLVSDNDAAIVASRRGGMVTLVEEVAAAYGQLGLRAVPLRPAFPEGKGFIERMIDYLQTSFVPLRSFASLGDLQDQADEWTSSVADARHVRRLGGTVTDALGVERSMLRRLPSRWPDVDAAGGARQQGRLRAGWERRLLRAAATGRATGGGARLTDRGGRVLRRPRGGPPLPVLGPRRCCARGGTRPRAAAGSRGAAVSGQR